ncbi:DUF3006 family protein [Natronomonas moolapensis 8.8.11]|uniref:DUF3006 family protein n=1 Tax=Natronomonas moolapensis (strain DSM 18674 / CECT 7526 / JCM 14361 / 8.8.11) TaxID=268739 RepID=M1XKZ6_NATM8|nr:DUF3006 domain-containing protein [Natronomonas moolapensis]CCQ36802.1 DUF3006 family protein [Natronomonas moolapensis 8.8.11]
MIPDSSYTAVIDEFEGSLARLKLADDSGDLYELVVETEALPEDGRETGAVLAVEVLDEALVEAAYDSEETKRRRESARERFDRLSKRPDEDE